MGCLFIDTPHGHQTSKFMIIDCHNHVGMELFAYLSNGYPYGQDIPTLVAEANRHHVDYSIIFPSVSYIALDLQLLREGRIRLAENGLAHIPYAFENERLATELYQFFPDFAERLLPFAIADPLRRVPEQLEVLKRQHEAHPFWGIKIQSTVIQAPILSLLKEGIGLIEFAEENNLPFLIHTSKLPTDLWAQALDVIKIAETWPSVRFCLAHSCRFDKTSLDRIAELDNCWFDCSAHRIHCMLAAKEHPAIATKATRFNADYRDPDSVLAALAEAYPHKLMWGSDSPYYSFAVKSLDFVESLFSTYSAEAACLTHVPAHLRSSVAGENTAHFLGRALPVQKEALPC